MTLTFYDYKMAPSPRRARIILAEKKVPHETVEIDMMTNVQMSDAYRQINPNCTIPALKLDDGSILTNNAGIAAYLEAHFPEPALMGTTAIEKAEIASWQSKIEQEFAMGVAHALRNANPAMKDRALPGPVNFEQIPDLSLRGLKQIEHFLELLEVHLEGKNFIATDKFTLADITAAVTLDFARVVKRKPSDQHINIKRWRAALGNRPSFNL